MNIHTIEQLAHTSEKKLEKLFKKQAKYLKEASWGIDNSEVNEDNYHKNSSISTTETLPFDLTDPDKLKEHLLIQTEKVSRELRDIEKYVQTVAVIFKNNLFQTYSAQETLDNPTDDTRKIYKKVVEIFDKNYKEDPIRLIGVRLSSLQEQSNRQLSIFEEEKEDKESISFQKKIDNINKKLGKDLITPASLMTISKHKKEKK